MTLTTKTTTDAVRLRLDPQPSRTTVLDGGWWPRSTNAADELPALITALAGLRGAITHVLLSAADWDLPHPRRIGDRRGAVHLGWYTSQPAGLISLMSEFGQDRFDLLVVPPDASPASSDAALAAAADGADRRRTPELLAQIEHTG